MKKIITFCLGLTFLILCACSSEYNKEASVTPIASDTLVADNTAESQENISEKEYKIDLGTILEGEIGGAKYKVHVPEKWNGKLLIYAHGLRQAYEPLEVTLETDSSDHIKMIKDGWIVAATSFRRNGFILGDAFEDIDNLREFIERKYGKSNIAIVQGYSMGGLIATRMAECGYDYSGFLAIGAVYDISVKYTPQKPILFLSNQDEVGFPLEYCGNVQGNYVKPAVWKVSRDGHCNVNGKEVSACIDALLNWIENKEIVYEKDITMENDLAQ
ncbi:alpha/beta fold hydrolase domain-containing protein [Acetivibrio cellulolyticus]|uniref:alpha/beta hydrolase n=1 Tax=Acetivibrio cellulolyticus TaxID=35830 RepID=UPI0001E301C4|nr:alpha/beta hydrolase [Acetivibrio cellulolyticus]